MFVFSAFDYRFYRLSFIGGRYLIKNFLIEYLVVFLSDLLLFDIFDLTLDIGCLIVWIGLVFRLGRGYLSSF